MYSSYVLFLHSLPASTRVFQGYIADGLQSTESSSEVYLRGGHGSFFGPNLPTFLSSNYISFSTFSVSSSLSITWDSAMNDSFPELLPGICLSMFCPVRKKPRVSMGGFTLSAFPPGHADMSYCRHKEWLWECCAAQLERRFHSHARMFLFQAIPAARAQGAIQSHVVN